MTTPNRARSRRQNGTRGVHLRDDADEPMDADNVVDVGGATVEGLPPAGNTASPPDGPPPTTGSGSAQLNRSGPPATALTGSGPQSGNGLNPGNPNQVILEGHPVGLNGPFGSVNGPRSTLYGPMLSGNGPTSSLNGPRPSVNGPPRSGLPGNGPQPTRNGRPLGQAHLLIPGSLPCPYVNGVLNGPPRFPNPGNGQLPHANAPWFTPPAHPQTAQGSNPNGRGLYPNGTGVYQNGHAQLNPHTRPFAFGPEAFANANEGAGNGRGVRGGRGGTRGGARGAGGGGRGRGLGRGVPPGHMSIDALLASDARRLMPVLDPARENGAFWFGSDNGPRRVIVAAIRRHFDGPWYNITSVPNETIIQWWGEFIQSFFWEQVHGAEVYSHWHSITAARLRDMVSKAKRSPYKPDWISETIWGQMWEYWNSEEGQRRSRIAAANRLSDRDGLGPHSHTAGSRSYARLREIIREREGVEPSFWRLLRETHRKADGTYSDARVESIDQAMQVEIDAAIAASLATDAANSENPFGEVTQIDEDSIYLRVVPPASSGRVFGLGANQPIRERGESSAMAATRINLEQQVKTLQEQLAIVMEDVKRFKADRDASLSGTPPTQGTMASANGPARNSSDYVERTIDGAGLLYEVATEMANGIQGNGDHNVELGDIEGTAGGDDFGTGFAGN